MFYLLSLGIGYYLLRSSYHKLLVIFVSIPVICPKNVIIVTVFIVFYIFFIFKGLGNTDCICAVHSLYRLHIAASF